MFFLSAAQELTYNIPSLFQKTELLSPLEAQMCRYHVAGKKVLKMCFSPDELQKAYDSPPERKIFVEYFSQQEFYKVKNELGAYGINAYFFQTRCFESAIAQTPKENYFHIICSPFPRYKKFCNPDMMELIRFCYYEKRTNKQSQLRPEDWMIRLISEIDFAKKNCDPKIDHIDVTISGFGLGAKRSKDLAQAIYDFDPTWKTSVFAFNDISKDPLSFQKLPNLKAYHRYQFWLPDVYSQKPLKQSDVEAFITVHGLTSPLCYIKPWHHFVPPFSRALRLFGKF